MRARCRRTSSSKASRSPAAARRASASSVAVPITRSRSPVGARRLRDCRGAYRRARLRAARGADRAAAGGAPGRIPPARAPSLRSDRAPALRRPRRPARSGRSRRRQQQPRVARPRRGPAADRRGRRGPAARGAPGRPLGVAPATVAARAAGRGTGRARGGAPDRAGRGPGRGPLARPAVARRRRALARAGRLPLPPYIRDPSVPDERYQTVYARLPGSAAAPTAGLHFTDALWERLHARCEVVEVELRVGLDTFRPVTSGTLEEHPMHSEAYRVEPSARAAILSAVAAQRRVVCIGTTSVRVVETVADPTAPDEGRTSLLIAPGYRFRAMSALVTNFHLPRSTLLALVMAHVGVEETRRIYAEAIRERYRFYSFGDASLLL